MVIADTGPIIAFARLDLLALLPKVFERVYVTDAVVGKCLAGRDAGAIARVRAAVDGWFERIAVSDYAHLLLIDDLLTSGYYLGADVIATALAACGE